MGDKRQGEGQLSKRAKDRQLRKGKIARHNRRAN